MTQEEKQILLQDLCARLPYGVKVGIRDWEYPAVVQAVYSNLNVLVEDMFCYSLLGECFLYLRPMSSMTMDEEKEYFSFFFFEKSCFNNTIGAYKLLDWLNSHHFDYRRLIEKGLALEAPKDMYKID